MTPNRPIVIFGANGQIGRALLKFLGTEGIGLTRADVDLRNAGSATQILSDLRPRAVINATAYNDVDGAESEPEQAHLINAVAPGFLAGWCRDQDLPFVHYSTDYVFSGEGSAPWREDDVARPLNAYGKSKLNGERLIAESGAKHLIFRTSWVFSTSSDRHFLSTLLKLASERECLEIVDDQIGAPTFAKDASEATIKVLKKAIAAQRFPSGIYHLTNSGAVSRLGLAEEILSLARGAKVPLRYRDLKGIPSSSYPTLAKRPRNCRMDCSKLNREFAIELRPWRMALADCMNERFPRENH